jgi:hypothetical protein
MSSLRREVTPGKFREGGIMGLLSPWSIQELTSCVFVSWQRTEFHKYLAFSTVPYHPLRLVPVPCCSFRTQTVHARIWVRAGESLQMIGDYEGVGGGGGDSNSRPWGYEPQRSPRTKFLLSITPIKQWVAGGKDAFMCSIQRGF